MPLTGEHEPGTWVWSNEQTELYESSGGTRGTTLQGKPVVLLVSVGAKSGKLRKNPLMRVEHAGQYAVVASKGGDPAHPSWYHNLVAQPHVELQDGPVKKDYRARIVSGEERQLWWERAVAVWPQYDEYRAKTDREIPVFVLTPLES
ncbi:nitroreductase family deazaflavin-dependent oxidoreductase [Streptomyces sp. KL118A]|uniref:nitroreductase family deazaflavin-dependent oxidoreductase n=1 Tax=Streptomyces sp. KL118A TaxID=3045153 RepID=UPI00278C074E|nr:nitroreductase family deazaflavin-dependent oxidoreductase [Streptomyces sp. KL118A]